MRTLRQVSYLTVSFIFILAWQLFKLDGLTIPAIGLLAGTYLILSLRQRGLSSVYKGRNDQFMIGLLTALVLLVILATGSLTSPLFFLLYFIPFVICIMLPPKNAYIYMLGILLLFMPIAISESTGNHFIQIGSVLLITPLAYFFGKEYQIVSIHEKKDREIAATIRTNASNLLRDEESLPDTDKGRIVTIINESDKLTSE